MVGLFAIAFVVLGYMVLCCGSEMSDGTVYTPRFEAAIIVVGALALVLSS